MNLPNRHKVVECGGRDTAFEQPDDADKATTVRNAGVIGQIFRLSAIVSAMAFLANSTACAQTAIWSGHDATNGLNFNWSDSTNWTGGTPGPATNIYFFDPGANSSQGVVDNIVNSNTTILSLNYGNTNGFHTTQINSGVTLTVSDSGAANLVFAGTGTDNGVSQTLY